MRRRATTLALAAALAALMSGCTSEVSGSASPAANSVTGSTEIPDEERRETFCSDVPALLQDITADLEDVRTDPASAVAALEDAVSRMEQVQPPDGVADEWDRLVAVWRDLRDLVADVDLTDPSAAEDLANGVLDLQEELLDAGTAVDEWGRANC